MSQLKISAYFSGNDVNSDSVYFDKINCPMIFEIDVVFYACFTSFP